MLMCDAYLNVTLDEVNEMNRPEKDLWEAIKKLWKKKRLKKGPLRADRERVREGLQAHPSRRERLCVSLHRGQEGTNEGDSLGGGRHQTGAGAPLHAGRLRGH